MLRPAITQIITKNESYYSLVIGVAKRAREIADELCEKNEVLKERTKGKRYPEFFNLDWTPTNFISIKKKKVDKELWQELYNLTKVHEVEFIKVKGHSDNPFNNRCDELARNEIKKI